MKTIFTSILPVLLAVLMSSTTLNAGNNSVPFVFVSTTEDSDSLDSQINKPTLPEQEEENYVDDIPFSTKEISAKFLNTKLPVLEPEAYVDDFPFETESIANRYLPADQLGIRVETESFVNDIPFSTQKIAAKHLQIEAGKYYYKTK
jgi:hypothetical protein